MKKMDTGGLFNCVVRAKKGPTDISSIENDRKMIDEKPDLKYFQLLQLPPENSNYTLRKCEKNQENELDDESEVVVECEDLKPNMNKLIVKKIDDYSPNHLQNVGSYEIPITREVKQKFVGEVIEKLNLNFDSELVEQNKKRRITQKFKNVHDLEKHIGTVNSDAIHVCEMCGKVFKKKSNMNRHIESLHNCITYSCDICDRKFTQKGNLKIHVDTIHYSVRHVCDVCGKTFSQKYHLKIHIEQRHDGFNCACDLCGKTFSRKDNLKTHIDSVHDKIIHLCEICGKKFLSKSYLKKHIDSVHNGVRYACDICQKTFSKKSSLKKHIDSVHNGVRHA